MEVIILVSKDVLVRSFPMYDYYLQKHKFLTEYYFTWQMLQVAEYHARNLVSVNSLKRPSIKVRRQKLLNFLQGILISWAWNFIV